MSVSTNITKQFDNGTVQVDITSKNARTRYYQVPANNARAFSEDFKKHDRRTSYITNTAFALSILGGVLLTSVFTKKLKSSLLKFITNTLGGIAGATAAIFACDNYINNKKGDMLKKYNAKEIFYNA